MCKSDEKVQISELEVASCNVNDFFLLFRSFVCSLVLEERRKDDRVKLLGWS